MWTRRQALAAALPLATTARAGVNGGWVELFDGASLKGWKASGAAQAWRVEDGMLLGDGPVSHLFYAGDVNGAVFKNFELEAEVWTRPGCNSGIYFHTVFQQEGFPKKGFEVQVNNTALGEGLYRERKRTGSLYGIRNVYKQLANDEEWFRLQIAVRGKSVQVRVNGILTVDYVEPTPAFVPPSQETERFLDKGTFALQCHDPGSKVRCRNIRVRPLADSETGNVTSSAPDETFKRVMELARNNYPMIDYHVHFKPGFGRKEALERSRRDGITYGLSANCGRGSTVKTDAAARAFVDAVRGENAFVGMQAEGGDWTKYFLRDTCARFDYIFNDGMIWTDDSGKWTRLYRAEDIGPIPDAEKFVEEQVGRLVRMLNLHPIDIYAIPTFLPEAIAKNHEQLWTPARMKTVATAAARNGVAIELNDRYRLPNEAFVKIAKEAGCRFALGTGNGTPEDLKRSEFGMEMIAKCDLKSTDFFIPGGFMPRAVDRKAHLLQG